MSKSPTRATCRGEAERRGWPRGTPGHGGGDVPLRLAAPARGGWAYLKDPAGWPAAWPGDEAPAGQRADAGVPERRLFYLVRSPERQRRNWFRCVPKSVFGTSSKTLVC